jgi:hypothetical protein
MEFPTTVEFDESTRMFMEMPMGIWWPKQMYITKFKRSPKEVCWIDLPDGAKAEGGVADPKHGNPAGTVAVKKQWWKGVSKRKRLEGEEEELRAGQKNETYREYGGRVTDINVVTKDGKVEDDELLQLQCSKRRRALKPMDSSEDSIDYISCGIRPGSGTKRQVPAASDGGAAGEDQGAKATPKKKARGAAARDSNAAPSKSPAERKVEAAVATQLKDRIQSAIYAFPLSC